MNIFLSWSGTKSKKVAILFKEWLPQVIQALKPWLSTQDIRSGSAWHNQIQDSLSKASYGIFCITQENKDTPWILFEAGAISKGNPDNGVCTFLVDLETTDLLKNPLSSFNHTLNTKDSLFKLLKQLNSELGDIKLADEVLKKVFEKNYPDFEAEINTIIKEAPAPPKEKGHQEKMLEEILNTVRKLERPSRIRNLSHYLASGNAGLQPSWINREVDSITNIQRMPVPPLQGKWISDDEFRKYLDEEMEDKEPYESESAKAFRNRTPPKNVAKKIAVKKAPQKKAAQKKK